MGEGAEEGTYVSRLHMVKWGSRGGDVGRRRVAGMSEDIGLEGGLYSQGEVWSIFLWGPGIIETNF